MGYWIKEGEKNEPLENARMLSLDDVEAEILKFMEEQPSIPKENSNGSFERLMMSMGNGMQKG